MAVQGLTGAWEVAGESWRIDAPDSVHGYLDIAMGHLACPDHRPADLDIDFALTGPQRDLGTIGTVISHDGSRQELPGVTLDRPWPGRIAVGLHGDDPVDIMLRTEVMTRISMLRAAERGLIPLHGSAIGTDGRYWLIPAIGGAGKSTATACALIAGAESLGDDLVLWDPSTHDLWSVSRVIRLNPDMAARIGSESLQRNGFRALWTREDLKRAYTAPRIMPGGALAGLLLIGTGDATASLALQALASSAFQHGRVGLDTHTPTRAIASLAKSVQLRGLVRDPDLDRWGTTLREACRD